MTTEVVFVLILPRPPRATRADTRFPDTTRFRSWSPRRRQRRRLRRKPPPKSKAAVLQKNGGPCGSPFSFVLRYRLTVSQSALIACATNVVPRSEEHTSELQSLMRTSYAVFCLQNKKRTNNLPQRKHDLLHT